MATKPQVSWIDPPANICRHLTAIATTAIANHHHPNPTLPAHPSPDTPRMAIAHRPLIVGQVGDERTTMVVTKAL